MEFLIGTWDESAGWIIAKGRATPDSFASFPRFVVLNVFVCSYIPQLYRVVWAPRGQHPPVSRERHL